MFQFLATVDDPEHRFHKGSENVNLTSKIEACLELNPLLR